MTPNQRERRLQAVLRTWRSICNRRGLTQDQKDKIFEDCLIRAYGLGATARRDYRVMVENIRKRSTK